MRRGEIYYITSSYREEGSEQHAGRPAVIVSNNKNNENSGTVEVVYMTTRPKKDLPTHVITRSTFVDSTILCEQITTVGTHRVGDRLGKLTESELQAVDRALAISLGIDFGQDNRPADCHHVETVMREPTEEEWAAIRESVKNEILVETPAAWPLVGQVKELVRESIKAQSERDVYRDLYHDLLEHVKGGVNG